jgi:hypothetical protein
MRKQQNIPRVILARVHATKRPMDRAVNTTDLPRHVFASSAADSGGSVAPCVAAPERANTNSICTHQEFHCAPRDCITSPLI